MATKTIAGKTVQVNDEGFMTNPAEWDKDIAVELAKEEGIAELTAAHWKVIEFCRPKAPSPAKPPPCARSPPARAFRPKNSSACSPRVRPRKWPAFPAWANPKAVFSLNL